MMNRRHALTGLAAATAVGLFDWLRPAGPLSMAANAQEAATPVEIAEMALGDPEAPVEVIEYASFTCPHCANFHKDSFAKLKADYIDTGKVRFIYREVYFDRYGLWAGMLARCGGEMRYFGLVDVLYEKQREWAQGEPSDIAAALRKIGKTAGLSDEQLDACMGDQATAEAMVARFEETTKEHGIEATPSFVIDGKTYRNMDYAEFAELLDERVAAAG